jgi:predicted transcriptional regulator
MKTILMSIKARHNRNIESGLKKSELRLKPPTCELPFKVLTYESGFDGRHKVVNEWICDNIIQWRICVGIPAHLPKAACVSAEEIREYSGKNYKDVSEMRITNLKIYDKPKELSEFYKKKTCNSCKKSGYVSTACMYDEDCKVPMPITRAPQSWCYVEELEE